MDLGAAVERMRAFIEDEAAARRALLLEPDDVYRAAAEQARTHLRDDVWLGFGRAPGSGPVAVDADERRSAERLGPRVLFVVTRHERAGSPVFRAYTGDPTSRSMYGVLFNLADVDGELKIVGRASSDRPDPPGAPEWVPLDGDQLDDAGPALEAAKFERPSDEASAAHYDSLG